MKTTRQIIHGDGHTDIETYLQDAEGVWMWAVTQCNGGLAMTRSYNGLNSIKTNLEAAGICKHDGLRLSDPKCTHATPAQIARTKKMDADYDFMQTYKDQARLCNRVIEDVNPRIDFIFEVLDGVETDTINEHRLIISRLDGGVDVQDAVNWQDEPTTDSGKAITPNCDVNVSQYFNGYKATATKEWAKRHLNESNCQDCDKTSASSSTCTNCGILDTPS